MNEKNITIDKLSPGEFATVEELETSTLSGRLRDLGLVSGAKVRCLHRAPLGDPTAYEIKGAVIALRREDSRYVHVKTGGAFDG